MPHAPCIEFKLLAEPKLGTADPQLLSGYAKALADCKLSSERFNEEDRSDSVARGISLLFHRFSYISVDDHRASFTIIELKDIMEMSTRHTRRSLKEADGTFDPYYLKDMQDAIMIGGQSKGVKRAPIDLAYMTSTLLPLTQEITSDKISCLSTEAQTNYESSGRGSYPSPGLTDRITAYLLTLLCAFITMSMQPETALADQGRKPTRAHRQEVILGIMERFFGGARLPSLAKYINGLQLQAIIKCDVEALRA